MAQGSEERLRRVREQLEAAPGLAEQFSGQEGRIVRDVLDGQSVHEVAQALRISEAAVWETLGNAARMAMGQLPQHPIEIGGLGSDTDPGVTGGYGDTAFGSLGNEPPFPTPEEPDAEGE